MKSFIHKNKHLRKQVFVLVLFILLQVSFLSVYIKHRFLIRQIDLPLVSRVYFPVFKLGLTQLTQPNLTAPVKMDEKAQSLPILIYHGVVDKADGANIVIEDFNKQMLGLKEAGYQAVSLDDAIDFLKGKKELPAKSFLLTFDDGRKDSFYPVDPVLSLLDYHATIFIITGHSLSDEESRYYLTRDEIKMMLKSGRWDVQPHTHLGHDLEDIDPNHSQGNFYSNYLWLSDENRIENDTQFQARVSEDINIAKGLVEAQGEKARVFAFPFGDFGQDTKNNPNASHYLSTFFDSMFEYGLVQERGGTDFTHNLPQTSKKYLTRIGVGSNWSPEELVDNLEMGQIKRLPYREKIDKKSGWRASVGTLSVDNNQLFLSSGSNTTVRAILDGSQAWKDYAFEIDADWQLGSNLMLIARYSNPENNVFCNFGSKYTRVEQIVSGKRQILLEKKHITNIPNKNKYVISVFGNTISCAVNGEVLAQSQFDASMLGTGGIGIMMWDVVPGNALISVGSIGVEKSSMKIGDPIDTDQSLLNKNFLFFGGFETQPWQSTFGASKLISDNAQIVRDPSGKYGNTLKVNYKKGSYASPSSPVGTSATSFHSFFDDTGLNIGKYDDLYLRYLVRFESGFNFNKSGKLPGLAGGTSNSGGHPPNGIDGWSGRLNWVDGGQVISYLYVPGVKKYGLEIPWQIDKKGATLETGQWECLEIRIKLNTPGKKNGVMQGWLNGELAMDHDDLYFRDTESLKIDNLMFDTFFGGDTPDFASPKNQSAYFDNFVISTNPIGCPAD